LMCNFKILVGKSDEVTGWTVSFDI